mmetsp:Transcript_21693/g.36314  ORF Transcript_21693/g.36314 Transcript_21693/m.36314 type:complete len:293 (+) Transcript_21693:65-943(+)|eukprot:CAMPEP_0174985180 /NCGR_PEP_ID=MMETSP0004_2-20121128/18189_1 /TAXON_ID=420556 /ORGANISM="Ochromonas sp., Strain CCMP1393" /LENGTH=292 /DNA_ID=CAMNT_0016237781 /DNA_START=57 /DNA_END=935 /DNA_ORIENTATION=+
MEGCPVDHGKNNQQTPVVAEVGECPVQHTSSTGSARTEQQLEYNADANDLVFGQHPSQGQKSNLSVERSVSTIPKGNFTPTHQPEDTKKWVYPSEQQYYNAMKRKGYSPEERDVPVVLYIHNQVNEQGWKQIKEWEAFNGNMNPRLVRFMGKPTKMSPKAYLMSFLGYAKPFDRHDWFVDRDGKTIRYVIDFYGGARMKQPHPLTPATRNTTGSGKLPQPGPVSIYLDVRPALDTYSALATRLSLGFRQRFQPFSLPKWCLMSSPFFQAVESSLYTTTSRTSPASNNGSSNK